MKVRRNKHLPKPKQLIGRAEVIDLPGLALWGIPAKIDTGAYTSALHCSEVHVEEVNGQQQLIFFVELGHHQKKQCVTHDFREKNIRNSFGQVERRFVVRAKIEILGRRIFADFSLADREQMRFPVLIGRKLLKGRFIVDVSLKNLSLTEAFLTN